MSVDDTAQSKRSFFARQRENPHIGFGMSIKHMFHGVSSGKKTQEKTMTFEEKTKSLVIDDHEQWIRFRHELNERGILTSNGVQEYLVTFVQGIEKERYSMESQNSDESKEETSGTEEKGVSNIPKRLRDFKASAKNSLEKIYSSTFNFSPKKEDNDHESDSNGFRSVVQKEWTSKFQKLKFLKNTARYNDDFDKPRDLFTVQNNNLKNPLKMTGIKNVYSQAFGSQKTESTTEPVYIRRCSIIIDQETLKNELDMDDDNDAEIISSHNARPIEAREIYTFGSLQIDEHKRSFKMLCGTSINVSHEA